MQDFITRNGSTDDFQVGWKGFFLLTGIVKKNM